VPVVGTICKVHARMHLPATRPARRWQCCGCGQASPLLSPAAQHRGSREQRVKCGRRTGRFRRTHAAANGRQPLPPTTSHRRDPSPPCTGRSVGSGLSVPPSDSGDFHRGRPRRAQRWWRQFPRVCMQRQMTGLRLPATATDSGKGYAALDGRRGGTGIGSSARGDQRPGEKPSAPQSRSLVRAVHGLVLEVAGRSTAKSVRKPATAQSLYCHTCTYARTDRNL
jgi:hypothetical protein